MKGCDIVVGGSVGHMSGFMAQAGNLVVCGDAGAHLGDSLYEAQIYVGGKIHSLGSDAQEEPMTEADHAKVADLLKRAELDVSSKDFKRVAIGAHAVSLERRSPSGILSEPRCHRNTLKKARP